MIFKNNDNNNNNNNTVLLQKMHIYCKKCIKHISNTFPKKLIIVSKNKIKGKSKCPICLTGRTFIDEIEGDLKIYWLVINLCQECI